MPAKFAIQVWFDLVCPWCYIGKRRLETALTRFPHADLVELSWHAYQLEPAAPQVSPPQCEAERLAKKYGVSGAQGQAMIEQVVKVAALEGLAFDYERIRRGNTFDAHRLLKLARRQGLEQALQERLMRGYFCEGAALGDHQTLLRLAGEVGLEVDEAAALLSDDLFADQVRADLELARRNAIQSVPFFVFGERYALPGAQPAELMLQALTRAFQEHEAELASQAGGAP